MIGVDMGDFAFVGATIGFFLAVAVYVAALNRI
jgi:hypothetical protein